MDEFDAEIHSSSSNGRLQQVKRGTRRVGETRATPRSGGTAASGTRGWHGEKVEPHPRDVEDELRDALGGEHTDPVAKDALVGVAKVARQLHGAEGARMGSDGVGDAGNYRHRRGWGC
jgi:hypothetical protein